MRNQKLLSILRTAVVVLATVLVALSGAEPLGRSRYVAHHVPKEEFSLKDLFVWPNTYYDRPRHRYPYYNEHGNGKLVYGYGGRTLYKYSIFRPLEGYFRR